ncbi:MAG: FAD-dependent oxidoreductase [Pontiellaceae bacterium]|nr:FAD-dependent oxidoreductase [Pontiellaceae bacterium]MBN2784871.1 FAD-dependent oxidoreductase [Pontiellaceae bacterium]
MSAVQFTLNGAPCTAARGDTILDAAKAAGFFIPTFCHRDDLKPFASCFVCAVEVEGRRTLVPSCSTEVTEGMVVNTENERVKRARKTCLDLLLSDHVGDCLGPCMTSCPAGIDIPGFVNHIANGRHRDALELIVNNMPLAGCLGRVCTRPCEEGCRRQLVEKPVAICQLKRFPADRAAEEGWDMVPSQLPSIGKKVAVVGAGPSGLSAAYYLRMFGIDCTVFDAHEAPGGMIRYGIPSYRLPRSVIDREVAVIEAMGAEFRYSTKLGSDITLEQLREEYDAVFLGLGAQKASGMRTPGEELPGVRSGIEFLGAVSRDETLPIGREIIVVGGGNTAIDASRTALRLGAESVTILYRRAREQMPAWDEEIEDALDEGVKLETLAAPVKIESVGDRLSLTCIRMELGAPDESGRRRPVPVEGSEFSMEVDEIIAAIGQNVDSSMVSGVDLTSWGSIKADEVTGQTLLANVFAGGDCVTGADIAVNAVAAGRRAAFAIHQYLLGEPVVGDPRGYVHSMGALDAIPEEVTAPFEKTERVSMPRLEAKTRASGFDEVETGFTEEQARAEAARCMECGCRDAHECALRDFATRFDASASRFAGDKRVYHRDDSHPELVYEEHKCIQCGCCVRACDELLQSPCVGFAGRGFDARVKPALDRRLALINSNELSKLASFCPVGALTLKNDAVATLKPGGFPDEEEN